MNNNQSLINYTNRDFESLRSDLINYIKTRHSDKFSYFNDASSDMMYLEMLAYLGDNLNYQIDKSFNENFRKTVQNREAILRIADNMGFYDWYAKPSITQAQISIDVPATTNEIGSAIIPHPSFLIAVNPGMTLVSKNGVVFQCEEEVNFANEQLRTIVPNYDGNGTVKNFTITKTVKLIAGEIRYQRFYVDAKTRKEFMEIILNDDEITEVMSIVEKPGQSFNTPIDAEFRDYDNVYLEVQNLSDDKIFVSLNGEDNDDYELRQVINAYTDMSINYGVWVNKPKRFITRRDINGRTKIVFGNSTINRTTWENLVGSVDLSSLTSFTINQILNNNSLGEIPKLDTTLWIKYRRGAGIKTNATENEISQISSKSFKWVSEDIDQTLMTKVKNSLKVYSNLPAIGGSDEMKNEEIKQVIGKVFSANDRIVTYDDIVAMINKMPPSYGTPFRVSYEEIKPKVIDYTKIQNYLIKKLNELSLLPTNIERQNKIFEIITFIQELPTLTVDKINEKLITYLESSQNVLENIKSLWIGEKCNLYLLGINKDEVPVGVIKNDQGVFKSANIFMKQNIKNYLINKKIIGDWVNILDANIINIQVEFKIIADNKNKQKVLIDCLNKLRNYFSVYNWNINQPIYISNVSTILQEVEGVINVVDIKFYNVFGEDTISGKKYSEAEIGTYYNNSNISTNLMNNRYEMLPVNNILLSRPSDMFNIRYPDDDIRGYII